MSSKVEYLEKYSVAPPPSRDYYGIKVLQDEVILFLWKISHGPHKAPTIRVTKFFDFHEDKSLQDEIQRVFGNYMLEHVRSITLGQRNSILTFPRNVIASISKYLKFKDIINLTILSRASKEVFDNDIIWETLYRRYKRGKICKEEKQYAMATSWKQLLKDKKLQESIKNQKPVEDKTKVFKSPKIKRTSNINSTTSSINSSSSAFPKKAAEDSKKLSNKKSPLRLDTPSKVTPDIKNIYLKSTISMTKIPDQSTKNLFVTNKSKQDLKDKELVTNRSQLTTNKSVSQKVNSLSKHKTSITPKSTEDLKYKKSSITNLLEPKLKSNEGVSLKNRKLIPDSKKRSKEISKAKKISESKSTILSNDKTLFNNLHIDEINSLIEESLTKLKTPRSMFDYDFSILGDKKSAGDSRILSPRPENQNLKKESGHIEAISKISARSDSHSEDDDSLYMSHFTQKYLDSRAEFMKKMADTSNLSFSKAQSSNSLNGKFPKPLSTIPEKFKKTRASIFAAKEVENTNIVQDQFKIRSTKESNVMKK